MKNEYAVLIDYKVGKGEDKAYEPFMIEVTDVISAVEVAGLYMNDSVYMITVLESRGKKIKEDDYKVQRFVEILTNRGEGWNFDRYGFVWDYLDGKNWNAWRMGK